MHKFILKLIFATLLISQAFPVFPQTTESAPAPPAQAPPTFCEDNPGFDQWDFWVGEWNVYSNDEARTFSGSNSITKHYNGCLIKETWESAGGGGGFSINYFNPVKDEWRQVWVSNGYSIDYTGGLNETGALVLEGEIYTYANGVTQGMRGIWTPEENGDVVQHFDTFDAESGTWQVWFEGRYVKKDSDSKVADSE